MFRSRPLRFILPIDGNRTSEDGDDIVDYPQVSPEELCNLGCETPRINNCKIGHKYRYFYAISSDVDAENPGTVIILLLSLTLTLNPTISFVKRVHLSINYIYGFSKSFSYLILLTYSQNVHNLVCLYYMYIFLSCLSFIYL